MFYPLCIEMTNKAVLIIGGGQIGLHKAEILANAGAKLTLIAPERLNGWDALSVLWQQEPYGGQPLDGYFLVICATDDPVLNGEVAAECKKRGILCDNTSAGTGGDLIFPAVVQKGGYTAAVTSNGQTPFLTKKIKGEIEEILAPYDEETVALLTKTRFYILEHFPAEKKALLCKLALAPLNIIREKGNPDEISDWLQREQTGAGTDEPDRRRHQKSESPGGNGNQDHQNER
jgi:precorrin-2 dehydrogenase/sirohydrochlorin ferrochelatase